MTRALSEAGMSLQVSEGCTEKNVNKKYLKAYMNCRKQIRLLMMLLPVIGTGTENKGKIVHNVLAGSRSHSESTHVSRDIVSAVFVFA